MPLGLPGSMLPESAGVLRRAGNGVSLRSDGGAPDIGAASRQLHVHDGANDRSWTLPRVEI